MKSQDHRITDIKDISVILPTFDERQNIVDAILRAETTLGDRLLEIIVVDDDSPDRTWEVVADLNHPRVKLIRRENEKGLASAIAHGVSRSSGEIVVWLDCDLGVPPEVLGGLIKRLEKHDVAIASRFVDGGQDQRAAWIVFCSYLINRFSQLLLGSGIKDYTSGVIALKRDVINEVSVNPKGFGEYFIEFVHTCARKGFSIVEVGYCYKDRAAGYSKSTENILTFLRLGIQYGVKVLAIRVRNSG
jgi:dolichol-phosphate mannosyltransferase